MKAYRFDRLIVWASVVLALGVGLIVALPVETLRAGPPPVTLLESQIFLAEEQLVRQTIVLDQSVDLQVRFRLWVRLEPSDRPYLRVWCGDQTAAQATALPLPLVDQAYHAVETPWCEAPEQQITIWMQGKGVRVVTTAVDRLNGALEIAGVSMPNTDLALQLIERRPGIDRYIPVSRLAAGKTGLFGWPHFYLIALYVYVILVVVLVRVYMTWDGSRNRAVPSS